MAAIVATPIGDEKGGSGPMMAEVVGYTDDATTSPSLVSPRTTTPPEKLQALRSMGMPPGLAECLAKASESAARRYWIVDNSGSMNTQDGNRVLGGSKMVSCSRWAELGDSLRWHGQVAATLGAHTEFRMLNLTNTLRTQKVVVGAEGSDSNGALDELNAVIQSTPGSVTPLCSALRSVIADIRELEPHLRAVGRTVSVIIASDGEASDGDMNAVKATLAPLAHLPCDVVVRLCTDQDNVVNYWNDIDNDLELDLDVLDDTAGEGVEVRQLNPWIGYGEALHRVREFGCAPKVFDFLDERPLYISEATNAVRMILGDAVDDLPNPELDADGYMDGVKKVLSNIKDIFDASQKKLVPWIDLKSFSKKVLKKSDGCLIS